MTEADPTNSLPSPPVNEDRSEEAAPQPIHSEPSLSEAPKPRPVAPRMISPALMAQQRKRARAFDLWMIVLVVVTLGGSCLLISAGQGSKTGMRPWSANSVLRSVVELLNFNYAYPTPRGVAVKWLAQGLGAAAALMIAGLGWYLRRRDEEDYAMPTDTASPATTESRAVSVFDRIPSVAAAQIALVAFACWMMLSYRWSQFPVASLGEGMRNLIVIIWAVAIGRTLTVHGAVRASAGMVAVLVVTAILGLWYYFERNPVMRLEFPIGNPIFFAACMIPALSLGIAGLVGGVSSLFARSTQGTSAVKAQSMTAGLLISLASVATLGIVGWAFHLTHSRSPAVALLVALYAGGIVVLARAVSAQKRRLVIFAGLAIVVLGYVAVGRPWLEAQRTVDAGGRGATLRLRYLTWQYAQDMFLQKPLSGHGQGAYVLVSQRMAYTPRDQWGRSDAEKDPTAFNSTLIGHAHNEWLEILADLGAIGFALMATAIGLTFYAGVRAYMRATSPAERWCLLGLQAALLAIIIEECADVALRIPGLPLVFYTVIGLTWAMSRNDVSTQPSNPPILPARLRPIALIAAIFGTMTIVSAVRRDFAGALAEGKIDALLTQQQWLDALACADEAIKGRMTTENFISASLQQTAVAYAAAAHRFDEFRNMLARQDQVPPAQRGNIRSLAEEDIGEFNRYFDRCVQAGEMLQKLIPGIAPVPERMGRIALMKAELEFHRSQMGFEPDKQPFAVFGAEMLHQAYLRNRFDGAAALQLLSLVGNAPIEKRMELLRLPLRMPQSPQVFAAMRNALGQMLEKESPSFTHRMETLLAQAHQAAAEPDVERWPDPYAPESLLLQALADGLAGKLDEAADLAGQAVKLYEAQSIRIHYPTALPNGLAQQAEYLFLADPEHPDRAISGLRRAIDCWPSIGERDEQLRPIRTELSLCLLAAGDEAGATELIRTQVGEVAPDRLNRNVGYGYAEICQRFMGRAPDTRPASLERWLNRSIDLAPDYPAARWMSAQVALESGNGDEAVRHLQTVRAGTDNPDQFVDLVGQLAEHFPTNTAFSAYAQSVRVAASQPSTSTAPVPAEDVGRLENATEKPGVRSE